MPRKGKKTMPQQQSTTPGQPQAQAQAHPAEQHLVAAGVPQQVVDHAKAHGINVGSLVGLIGQLLPLILQFIQQQSQGGGQPTAGAQRTQQVNVPVTSDPDVGNP